MHTQLAPGMAHARDEPPIIVVPLVRLVVDQDRQMVQFVDPVAESLTEACREHFHAAILPCHELRLQLARNPSERCAERHRVDSLLLWESSQLCSRKRWPQR